MGKSKPFDDEEEEEGEEDELAASATAALFDSLAAELRAKLGVAKMGPLLLPPRDYDGTNNNNNNGGGKGKKNMAKRQVTTTTIMFPLTRSESNPPAASAARRPFSVRSIKHKKNQIFTAGEGTTTIMIMSRSTMLIIISSTVISRSPSLTMTVTGVAAHIKSAPHRTEIFLAVPKPFDRLEPLMSREPTKFGEKTKKVYLLKNGAKRLCFVVENRKKF